MIFPKFVLRIGAFGCDSSFLSIGVECFERVMTVNEFYFVGFDISVVKLAIGVILKLFAERALEIAELDDSHFGVFVT